ncbi:MAG: hypothetical protein OEW02_09810, partial [Myxococcales bacterium]|nr:hypothetical protein [Myxococcales bacterium]
MRIVDLHQVDQVEAQRDAQRSVRRIRRRLRGRMFEAAVRKHGQRGAYSSFPPRDARVSAFASS